jgi:hypothetical protein
VKDLGNHHSVTAALQASPVEPVRHPAFCRALAQLAASDFLEPVPEQEP